MRAQAEDAKLVEPGRDGIAYAVRQVLRGGEVDLIPAPLLTDTRGDRVAKNRRSELGHSLRQLWLARRILDHVPRQRAAVADQMPQQRQLVVGHRSMLRTWQPTR